MDGGGGLRARQLQSQGRPVQVRCGARPDGWSEGAASDGRHPRRGVGGRRRRSSSRRLTRLALQARSGPGCWNGGTVESPELYVREHGETTVEVSAPEDGVSTEGVGNPAEPAVFVGASKDGSKVFFMTKTELTKEAERAGAARSWSCMSTTPTPLKGEARSCASRAGRPRRGRPDDAGGVETFPRSPRRAARCTSTRAEISVHHAGGGGGLYRYDTRTRHDGVCRAEPWLSGARHEPGEHAGTCNVVRAFWEIRGRALGRSGRAANYYTTGDGEFLSFPPPQNITGYDSDGQQELYRYDAGRHREHRVRVVQSGRFERRPMARRSPARP